MTEQIYAALAMIAPNMTISLGGGRHMLVLAEALAATHPAVTVCSPSEATEHACRELGLTVDQAATNIDIAFDGCDSVDSQLRLLKSNGAIFTDEKRNAMLAKQVVILLGVAHYQAVLDSKTPLTVETIDASLPLVLATGNKFGLRKQLRKASNYMGATRTRNGNLLVDLFAFDWQNIDQIDHALTALPGVLATSLFVDIATKLLIENLDGTLTIH